MSTPAFFGMYNAYRGLIVAQTQLNVTGHNIANVNTPGYSRQRVEISAATSYSPGTMYDQTGTNTMGQGSEVDFINRIREVSLDVDYRNANSVLGMEDEMHTALYKLESFLKEPSENSINASMQQMFDAIHEVAVNPQNLPARAAFLSQAQETLALFQEKAHYINNLRTTLVGDAAVPTTVTSSDLSSFTNQVNTITQNLVDVNNQIVSVQGSGGRPNDLMDRRDKLLQDLSELVDVTVEYNAANRINVSVGGVLVIRAGTELLQEFQVVPNPGPTPTPADRPALFQAVNQFNATVTTMNDSLTGGRIKGILDIADWSAVGEITLPNTVDRLNTLFETVATQFNTLQLGGRDLNGNTTTEPIFTLAAGTTPPLFRYSVNANLVNDPRLFAAANGGAAFAGVSDGRNAQAMTQIWQTPQAALGNNRIESYYNALVSGVAVATKAHDDRAQNTEQAMAALDDRRQEISGVNMDEEAMDLMRFQRAFEASSRVMTAMNQVYETIIGMVR